MTKEIKKPRLFEELILKSWWAILFFFLVFFVYDQAVKKREREEEKLQHKLTSLRAQIHHEKLLQEDLKREIASQNDDCWIELILMQKLGLVPEGQIKVHFVKQL